MRRSGRSSLLLKCMSLTEAFATLRRRGEEIAETTIAHIAPLGWEHINLIGNYHFAPQPGRSLDNLRPLRLDLPNAGEEAAAS
jgi:hypothetical protein